MTLSIGSVDSGLEDDRATTERPPKRKKVQHNTQTATRNADDSTLVRRHPLGVRPAGNALTSDSNAKAHSGLFARMPDELILHFLETLQVPHLLRLGATCRALHAFTRIEELWRALFVESPPSSFSWRGTWRSTYLSSPRSLEPRIDCSSLFSDVLHRPFFCTHVPLEPFIRNIPSENAISVLNDLSPEEFASDWVDRPFILRSEVMDWPVYKTWSTAQLLQYFADVRFQAESVEWPYKTYAEYMANNNDESPLYLFDRAFVEKMRLNTSDLPHRKADYWPPSCFGPDIFAVLGEQRPDHRWLIVGPERSGSTFHKDPNATSAWNAVIEGSKYWIMFPSSSSIPPPPGVYVSEDQSEVTSPLSIAEWLLGFHAEARVTPGCKEGICNEGEVLHVPSGWYHLVLNLKPSIAITQNFIPRKRVGAVLHFLRDQRQSISGFSDDIADPHGLFVERLKQADPELLQEGLQELERLTQPVNGKGRWEALKEDEEEGGFSFGFGGGEGDEEDVL